MNAILARPAENPFALEQTEAYLRWRERKLAHYPLRAEDLVVEVRDPGDLTPSESAKIRQLCAAANMAIYSSQASNVADKGTVRRLGERLGLARVRTNPLADEDGISSLETAAAKAGRGYVPYSSRRLLWHTDGYYNAPAERIGAFILHCVRPAAAGGENQLLDPEIAYIFLRDIDPAHVRALCAADAMTIPPNPDESVGARGERSGPVFSSEDGSLHMRYTARTRSIVWRADGATRAAVDCLNALLESGSPYVFTVRLEAGQGLVCNNVLHNRSSFEDGPAAGRGRLVYRARYAERVAPA